MPILNPAETFPIVRVLPTHTDTDTNYVQAVIRDATTDAVLATVNLTDKGNRRFQALWKVPWDNVFNQGRFIVITSTVYTDSGYTTKNPNYGEQGDTYLIQQRFDLRYLPGGGMDSGEARKIIKEELAALKLNDLEPIEFPAFPEIPEPIDHTGAINAVAKNVAQLSAKIDAIEIPQPIEPDEVDLSPLQAKLDSLLSMLAARPQFKETDLAPVIETFIQELRAAKDAITSDVRGDLAKPRSFVMSDPQAELQAQRSARLRALAVPYRKI